MSFITLRDSLTVTGGTFSDATYRFTGAEKVAKDRLDHIIGIKPLPQSLGDLAFGKVQKRLGISLVNFFHRLLVATSPAI